jgi:hypothetical protein
MVAAAALEELVLTADVVAAVPEEPVAAGALVLLEEELLDGALATKVSGLRWPQLFFSSALHFA